MKIYGRQDLIREVSRKHGWNSRVVMFSSKPTSQDTMCALCHHKTVRVTMERFGDGTPLWINWIAEVWSGICQRAPCAALNLWVELIDQEIIDRENRRLLRDLCDQQLKLLEVPTQ